MFVPYEPNNCFDVHRQNDKCVCGCSAKSTIHQGENKGYCAKCSIKREEIVNKIIGDIYIGEEDSLECIVLSTIEEMRKLYFRERLYYMVDCFFAEHQNDEVFVEPYEDDEFIAKMYCEKQIMSKVFLKSFSLLSNITKKSEKHSILRADDVKKIIPRMYENYSQQIMEIQEIDWKRIDFLNAKIGGYEHKIKSLNNI